MKYETSSTMLDADRAIVLESALLRLSDGDRDALAEIYDLCRASVYGFALSILKNSHDSEDVMQDTFVKVYAESGRYRPHGKPMAWILTITKNLCLHRLRQKKKFAENEEDWERHSTYEAEDERVLDSLVLKAAMAILSDEERQIVVLHATAEMKHREIAEIMGLPLATVLSKYNRAMKKLRNKMIGEEL